MQTMRTTRAHQWWNACQVHAQHDSCCRAAGNPSFSLLPQFNVTNCPYSSTDYLTDVASDRTRAVRLRLCQPPYTHGRKQKPANLQRALRRRDTAQDVGNRCSTHKAGLVQHRWCATYILPSWACQGAISLQCCATVEKPIPLAICRPPFIQHSCTAHHTHSCVLKSNRTNSSCAVWGQLFVYLSTTDTLGAPHWHARVLGNPYFGLICLFSKRMESNRARWADNS